MRVFLTGATGFVGSGIIRELKGVGHSVLGLARSDEAAGKLAGWGVEAHRGELEDTGSLIAAARACDGVIHCGYIHDFSRYAENAAIDRRAVQAMLGALEGSGKPFVLTSGTAMSAPGRLVTEDDPAADSGAVASRGGTEAVVLEAARRGVRGVVLRLPQVHGPKDHGFVAMLVALARQKGLAAYLSDGANRWPSVHRDDAARLYRLAVEKAEPGVRLHATAEEGVPLRAIAEAIGAGLGVPVRSLTPQEAPDYFGWMIMFAGMDNIVSSAITRRTLGWEPTSPDLLTDLREGDYFR